MFSKKQVQMTSDLYFSKLMKQLDYLLNEQRAQRADLAQLLRLANRKAAYYTIPEVTTLDEYETSPQTDSDEQ